MLSQTLQHFIWVKTGPGVTTRWKENPQVVMHHFSLIPRHHLNPFNQI